MPMYPYACIQDDGDKWHPIKTIFFLKQYWLLQKKQDCFVDALTVWSLVSNSFNHIKGESLFVHAILLNFHAFVHS